VWLFLALAWLHEHRSDFADPFQVIESLYAHFGYPETIEDLVRFMPAPAGTAVGPEALEGRWQDFLEAKSAEFRARGQRS
jgi:hypothetical protein